MIIGEPWGLLALAGIPAVVALHLWRRRHPPRPVSALFLYPVDRRVLSAGRQRAPVVLRPSFWLEILAVLLAAWWLADVHLAEREQARHLVLILDDRWRMQAVVDGQSSAERVRDRLRQRLGQLKAGDRVTLVASGRPPRLLAGPAAEPAQALAVLAAWKPQAAWHDLDAAVALAAGIAGAGAEISVISDRQPAVLPPGIGVLADGRSTATSGFADVRWWRDAAGERIVAVLHAAKPLRRELSLRDGQGGILSQQVVTAPGTVTLRLPDGLPEGAGLHLALDGNDPLPVDDAVDLVRPATRPVCARVLLDDPLAGSLRRALLAGGATLVEGESADLTVGSAAATGWTVVVVKGDGAPTLGPFTARRDHPLLADVDPTGVLWTGGARSAAGVPLLAASGSILISEERRGADHLITLHLDPAGGITKHACWPALAANLVNWRRSRLPGLDDPNPRCGQELRATLDGATGILSGPDGRERTLHADAEGGIEIAGLALAGAWSLRSGSSTWRIAALPLDVRQADLADACARELPASIQAAGTVSRRRGALASLLPLVILAAAGIAAWIAFRREERT